MLAVSLILSLNDFDAEAALSMGISKGESVTYSSLSDVTWTGDTKLLGTMITNLGYEKVVNAIIAASPTIYDTPNNWDKPINSAQYTLTPSDFSSSTLGLTSWYGAKAFTNYLNSLSYAGSSLWTLPTIPDNPSSLGYNKSNSPFSQLYYSELGGTAFNGIPDTNYFSNEQTAYYWSGLENISDPYIAWEFITISGAQAFHYKVFHLNTWAISPGNLMAIPVTSNLCYLEVD
jgi:hypothetical protein